MANVLGVMWVAFGGYVGWTAMVKRNSQTRRLTINLMIAMCFVVFGVLAALFGHRMPSDRQWMFLAFSGSLFYITWEFLKLI
ncbi:MAG: hypothetical protein RLZZ511_3498 [Cyanobacteriota bacterium]|jgi:uncharacterized membrane protein HdeD (DUF308 family)